jgi:toxin ParE1/3/4
MAASRRLLFRPKAEDDLEEIWRYTAKRWSPDQADRYLKTILAAIDDLARGARLGRKTDVRAGYLKLTAGSHVVYFRSFDDAVEIVRVLHNSMDVDRHL